MKFVQILMFLILFLSPLFSQVVEVEGMMKITKMDTINTEDLIVVKKPDGILATRQLNSLMSSSGDTTRTLQSDLLLTSALCNCPTLPPAMIKSLYNNGYAIQDLLDFNLTVSQLLSGGLSPLDIHSAGVPIDSLYGKFYAGGYIFYLDILDNHPFEGLVTRNGAFIGGVEWGCINTLVDATSDEIGTGQANTTNIVTTCDGQAAALCDGIDFQYDDWYLASKKELNLMFINLHQSGLRPFNTAYPYWTSTEINNASAWTQDFSNSNQSTKNKSVTLSVRPIRSF